MPIRDGHGYVTPTGFLCETCWLSEPRDPAIVDIETIPHARCEECQIALWLAMRPVFAEELFDSRAINRVFLCTSCTAEVHAVNECQGCTRTVCGSHSVLCLCSNEIIRCSACARNHAASCLSRIPRASGREPAFSFICDSEDENLVKTKRARPKLSKADAPRPRAGAFTVEEE